MLLHAAQVGPDGFQHLRLGRQKTVGESQPKQAVVIQCGVAASTKPVIAVDTRDAQ